MTQAPKIKTAVIGVGYLGQYHAEKIAQSEHAQLSYICDTSLERAHKIAEHLNTEVCTDYTQLADQVDAVTIATPTPTHHKIAQFFLAHNTHVLIEKPIATCIADAQDLIDTARKHELILQVGHLERFNNAIKSISPYLSQPRFIESTRLAPFQPRSSDVNVILDLMIHDIDLIQSMAGAKLTHISATGAVVVTPFIDIANARLEFANGCVANVTANRISQVTERKCRIFQHDSSITLDLARKTMRLTRKGDKEMYPGIPEIIHESSRFAKGDALKDQIEDFLQCIITNTPPLVSGEDGRQALETAIKITDMIHANNKQFPLTQDLPY